MNTCFFFFLDVRFCLLLHCKNLTDLRLSDSEVNLDGVQHSHPVGGTLSSCRLLAVDIEENGQEVLGEATHFGLLLLCRDDVNMFSC